MKIKTRFFRVTSGPLIARIREIQQMRESATGSYEALRVKVGASSIHAYESGTFAGFGFEQQPDTAVFRSSGTVWVPKKNCTVGKALWDEIKSLPAAPSIQNALDVAGLRPHVPALIEDGRGYSAGLGGFSDLGIWFVKVPWRDIPAEEMAEYKAQRAARHCFSACMEHLLWTPPAEWQEVREWEYLKEWDELTETPKEAVAQA